MVPILDPFFSGRSWGQLGPLLRLPGPSGCPSLPLPTPSWGRLGAILGHLGATLGLSCASLPILVPILVPILPPSCPTLGPTWAILGLCWAFRLPPCTILDHVVANLKLPSHMCSPIGPFFLETWLPASTAQFIGGGDVAPGEFYNSPPPVRDAERVRS